MRLSWRGCLRASTSPSQAIYSHHICVLPAIVSFMYLFTLRISRTPIDELTPHHGGLSKQHELEVTKHTPVSRPIPNHAVNE